MNKSFGNVHANRNINIQIETGTIHGIVGENGAGKSTLMNILYGFYKSDSGSIHIDGEEKAIRSPEDAIQAGIGMVHQHFMLVEPFTVIENVLLGAEGGWALRDGLARARSAIEKLESDYGLNAPLDVAIADLPIGIQQRVEILKALFRGAHILILDEPTGVLTPQEADELFQVLRNLRDQGRTIILITHKLREIMAVTDNVSVMRGGNLVAQRATSKTSTVELAELMVGRKVLLDIKKSPATPDVAVLRVNNVDVFDDAGVKRVKSVSFEVRAGEILGVAGVAGNGQSELLEAIAGIRTSINGEISLHGVARTSTSMERPSGLGHVPEDRLKMGLVKGFTANENIILGYQNKAIYTKSGFLRRSEIFRTCLNWMKSYDVRPPRPELEALSLSGGNQQKLVLAREIEHDPDLLLVGQPTRGVDIGAIEFIHNRLVAMRDAGKAVLLVSVELEEILSLADRIIVLFDGEIMGELAAGEANERDIGLLMAGVVRGEAA